MKNLLLFAILVITIVCCTDNTHFLPVEGLMPQDVPLTISTRVLSTESFSFVQEFTTGSVVGLYVADENAGTLNSNNILYNNVRLKAFSLSKGRIGWWQTPLIYLNAQPVTVYAYSPYRKADFIPTGIPVYISPDANSTDDYLYGTHARGQKIVNSISPVVLLTMHHALSLISFQVSLDSDIRGKYDLNAIQIGNKAGGNALFGRGVMDVTTGVITRTTEINASTRLTLGKPVQLSSLSGSVQQLMVIPTGKAIHEGDIEVLFTINGTDYLFPVPAATSWKKGRHYLYQLCFDGQQLHLTNVSTSVWSATDK